MSTCPTPTHYSMSDADNVLLGRAKLEHAFTALGERFARRGRGRGSVRRRGAAMALAYDAARVTRDVDAMLVPHGVGLTGGCGFDPVVRLLV
jgi:hypothetical protein